MTSGGSVRSEHFRAEDPASRLYAAERAAEVESKNDALTATIADLRDLLVHGLDRRARIDLAARRRTPDVAPLELGELGVPVRRPEWSEFAPRDLGLWRVLLAGTGRFERRVAEARVRYAAAVREAGQRELERRRRVVAARHDHAARVAAASEEARRHNAVVDDYARRVANREVGAVETYLGEVIDRLPLPAGFPHVADVTFNPRAEQAVVRFELPPRDVVPTIGGYRYLPARDEERELARPSAEIADLYRRVVSQVALLCIRDLFDADPSLRAVGLNGHVHAVNPATGQLEYPCIISLDVERAGFPRDDNLAKVTPEACVRHLRAIVSSHPYELEGVAPILDFDLSRFAFVDGYDAVSTLDSRPDLMEMSPTSFEHLVRQIFEAQGAEGWTTAQSGDDGVDAVVAQRSPLMGGLSIVQAKRYSRPVGVSHLRELAGAMEEKRAGWGILITTSWFASGCQEKARQHGRIELIDGDHLVHLIREHLHKDVLIGIPGRPPRG